MALLEKAQQHATKMNPASCSSTSRMSPSTNMTSSASQPFSQPIKVNTQSQVRKPSRFSSAISHLGVDVTRSSQIHSCFTSECCVMFTAAHGMVGRSRYSPQLDSGVQQLVQWRWQLLREPAVSVRQDTQCPPEIDSTERVWLRVCFNDLSTFRTLGSAVKCHGSLNLAHLSLFRCGPAARFGAQAPMAGFLPPGAKHFPGLLRNNGYRHPFFTQQQQKLQQHVGENGGSDAGARATPHAANPHANMTTPDPHVCTKDSTVRSRLVFNKF